jgi:hypothetical protein
MRFYWPWWMLPLVAVCWLVWLVAVAAVWLVVGVLHLVALPFQTAADRRRPARDKVTVRIRVTERAESD